MDSTEEMIRDIEDIFHSNPKWPDFPRTSVVKYLRKKGLSDIDIWEKSDYIIVSGIDDTGEETFLQFDKDNTYFH